MQLFWILPRDFLHNQIGRNLWHNIYAKSHEGNLTEKKQIQKSPKTSAIIPQMILIRLLRIWVNQIKITSVLNGGVQFSTIQNSENPQIFGLSANWLN